MYVVLEIKEKVDGSVEVSNYRKETKDLAEQAYHSVLSNAAVSTNLVHSGVLMNTMGQTLKSEYYKHDPPEQNN